MPRWNINAEQTTRYLADMVSINSVNPGIAAGGPGEAQIAAWLVETCRGLGLEAHLQPTSDPARPNAIARWRGSGGGKSLLLTGHTDVVQVDNMTIDPFDPRIEDGRLYGRGSFDMKGGLAAILGAVAALREGGFEPAGDIILGFAADEEFSSLGINAMVKEIRADAAILTEPSDLDICIAHKGFAWVTLATQGRAVHGSLYDEGIDAIAHMARLLGALDHMEQEIFPRQIHPLLGRSSAHASLIGGGIGASTYPDACTAKVEHRPLPGVTAEQIVGLWQDALARLSADDPRFSGTVSLDVYEPGYEIDRDAPLVQTLDAACREVVGGEPTIRGAFGWQDSSILGRAGIPCVTIGPGGDGAHAAVEYVELDKVYRCAAVLAEFATRWSGGESPDL